MKHKDSPKQGGKRRRIIISLIIGLPVLLVGVLAIWCLQPPPDDFGNFKALRDQALAHLEVPGFSVRPASNAFGAYRLGLNPVFALMFKTSQLELFERSWESPRLAAASVSQFEMGSGSGRYFDFTFMLRPRPEWAAPVLHGDALMALPGVSGAFYVDLYDPAATLDLDAFLGLRAERLQTAIDQVQPWWNHRNFGKLTPHLDPFKSRWRVEVHEPVSGSAAERRRYFAAVQELFATYLSVYLESVAELKQTVSADLARRNAAGITNFVKILYKKDIAVAMGRGLFPASDFDAYLLDAFWATGSADIKQE